MVSVHYTFSATGSFKDFSVSWKTPGLFFQALEKTSSQKASGRLTVV
jgi:hypothetical protein